MDKKYLYVCNKKRCKECHKECNHITELKYARYVFHSINGFDEIAPNLFVEKERRLLPRG